jgi:protein dithiol:quinone oxidoreductase
MRERASLALKVVLVGSLGAVVTALVSQYAFDMQPCAWCVLQRLIFLIIAGVSAVAIWLTRPLVRAALGGIIILLAGSGIASAFYQHVVAADVSSCRLSLAERIIGGALHLDRLLPSVFEPRVGCSAGATTMLGIPYEFWSLAAFALLALAATFALRAPPRAALTTRELRSPRAHEFGR